MSLVTIVSLSLLFVNIKFIEKDKISIKSLQELNVHAGVVAYYFINWYIQCTPSLQNLVFLKNFVFINNSDVISDIKSSSRNKIKIK